MKFNLIFEDNPISRCYIKIFQEENIKLDNLIILDGKFFLPRLLSLKISFNQNNYWPLKFLKEKYISLSHQIEDYFKFPRNFCKNMYAFENINTLAKIDYLQIIKKLITRTRLRLSKIVALIYFLIQENKYIKIF